MSPWPCPSQGRRGTSRHHHRRCHRRGVCRHLCHRRRRANRQSQALRGRWDRGPVRGQDLAGIIARSWSGRRRRSSAGRAARRGTGTSRSPSAGADIGCMIVQDISAWIDRCYMLHTVAVLVDRARDQRHTAAGVFNFRRGRTIPVCILTAKRNFMLSVQCRALARQLRLSHRDAAIPALWSCSSAPHPSRWPYSTQVELPSFPGTVSLVHVRLVPGSVVEPDSITWPSDWGHV